MRVGELAGVATLSRRLDLDEADKRIVDDDGIVRPRLHLRERRFADKGQASWRKTPERREFVEKPLERCPKLIFRSAGNGGIVELGLGLGAEGRDDPGKCRCWQGGSKLIEGDCSTGVAETNDERAPLERSEFVSYGDSVGP